MKINTKLTLILLELTIIPFIVVEFVAYSNAKNQIDSQVVSKLEAVASIQKSRIEEINRSNLDNLQILTHDPEALQGTANYAASPSTFNQQLLQNILNNEITSISSLRDISIASLNGKIIASSNKNLVGTDVSGFSYFQTGKLREQAYDFSKDPNGTVSLYISGPLVSIGKTVGVFIMDTDGSDINSIVASYEGLGNSGETLLVSKDQNGDVLFLTPIRFDTNAALTRTVTKDNSNVPSVHAANGEETVMLNALDYNNIPVIAVTKYLPDASWGIVTKISQSEAYKPVFDMFNLLTFMAIVSGIIIISISFAVARSFTDPIKSLTEFAQNVGKGDLSQRIYIKNKDELGTLAAIFNQTVAKLQDSYQYLEDKITQRTEELSKNVSDLENERRATLNLLEDLDVEKTKFESLIESIADGVIATDKNSKVIFINHAAKKMLGTGDDNIGKQVEEVLKIVDRNGDALKPERRPFNIAVSSKKPVTASIESDYYYISGKGTKVPVELIASPVITNGELIGGIDIFRDITHEKEVDKMKTEFVSLASHQLRTPLTAIKWGLELLESEDENFTERQKSMVSDIDTSNERMIELVNALLNISRIESGRIIINPVSTNILKLANDVISKLKIEMTKKNISLLIDSPEDLPEINLDYNLIYNVYQNLLTNAIAYSPTGGKITLTIKKEGDEIMSSVADSGIGIPDAEKTHIFEKFYRASNAKQVRPDGSGLGLYIVKSIIESSGGRIWFESEAGKGSTFIFTLPLSGMKPKAGEVSLS